MRQTFADADLVSRAITAREAARRIVRVVATEANASRLVFAAADPGTRGTVTAADASRLARAHHSAHTDTSIRTPVDAFRDPPSRVHRNADTDTPSIPTPAGVSRRPRDPRPARMQRYAHTDTPRIPTPVDASTYRRPTFRRNPTTVDTAAVRMASASGTIAAPANRDSPSIRISVDAFRQRLNRNLTTRHPRSADTAAARTVGVSLRTCASASRDFTAIRVPGGASDTRKTTRARIRVSIRV